MNIKRSLLLILGGAVLGGLTVAAALPKTYQFTGHVKAVDKDTFAVDNGKETWTFGRNGETKGADSLRAGDKVTVTYRMFATQVENKGGGTPKPGKK